MIEHIKSVLLAALVLTSFVQSGILLYSSPSYEERLSDEYIPQKIVSEQFEKQGIHQLTAPGQVLLHRDGEHRQVPYGLENDRFRGLVEKLHQTRFEKLTKVTPSAKDWKALLEEKRGLELRFNRDLPPETVKAFFTPELQQPDLTSVSRIWIYEDSKSKTLVARFISDKTDQVVQTTAALDSFDDWLELAEDPAAYRLSAVLPQGEQEDGKPLPDPLYLPEDPLPVKRYTYPLKEIKIEDMMQVLFQDPDLAKQTLELDNSKIYTDSTRTLQHNTKKETIAYNRPDSAAADDENILTEQLDLINQFMNRHGGWTGNYLLDEVEQDPDQENPFFRFRLYAGNLPVFWEGGDEISPAVIRLSAAGKGVTSYERSLRFPATQPDKARTVQGELPAKDVLLDELDRRGITPQADVRTIYAGYRADAATDSAVLTPVWVVQLKDGTRTYVEERNTTGRGTAWTGAKPKQY